jgi:Kiwa KwaB-like protein
MLGRRPNPNTQQRAFGHVALRQDAQAELETIVAEVAKRALSLKPVTYDPDDQPTSQEVMKRPLAGVDNEFQPAAAWSLERATKEISKQGRPQVLDASGITDGSWSFYTVRADVDGSAAVLIRSTSPTRALKHTNRVITQFIGGELRPLKHPIVGIDHEADAIVIDSDLYIFRPQTIERLFVDAAEVKARAGQFTATFRKKLGAQLSNSTATWIEKACSQNSNVGRRVERLNRHGALQNISAAELRKGLADAKLPKAAFGRNATTIELSSLDHAVALIDIAADLYYQPRFEKTSRRVASFRRLS